MTVEIIHGDCMEYMRGLPDNAFELAIVDPPYFPEAANPGFYGCKESSAGVARAPVNLKHWIVPDQKYFDQLYRVSNNQIIWGCNYYAKFIPDCGRIVWDKQSDSSTFSDAEIASQSFSKGVFMFRHMWNGMIQGAGAREKRIHPTQKPIKLYQWLLKNYAKPGDTILDTHLGSGSSAIAAHYAGFDFVGIELDPDYYAAAVARFDRETRQECLF